MKTLKDFNFKGKVVLLRSDLNSDVVNGKVISGERIKESAQTIKFLKQKGAKVVILAHQGNVGKDDFIPLSQHAKFLSRYTKVKFVDGIIGKEAILAITQMKNGDAVLLDNVRFVDDEFHPDKEGNKLVKALSNVCDIYVNDAFSVCHRNQTSITSFPRVMPSCAGLLLEREVKALKRISMKNTLFILGGAKPESNIKLLRGNKVLACGLFGQTCLRADGIDLGYQNDFLKEKTLVKGKYSDFLDDLRKKLANVVMPIDFAVNVGGKRKEYLLGDFPINHQIDDIGEETIKRFEKEIKKAKAIYMKGPAGFASDKNFAKGTNRILKAIANSNAFSLIGGGHLSDAIARSRIPRNKFGHISLSGGALLNYIAGEKLVGLKVLGWKG